MLELLKPLSFIHTINGEPLITCYECIMLSILNQNYYSIPNYIIEIGVGTKIHIKTFKLTEIGIEFWNQHIDTIKKAFQQIELSNEFYKEIQVIITNKLNGFFLLPEQQLWNYSFSIEKFSNEINYPLSIQYPLYFYNPLHRKNHFLSLVNKDKLCVVFLI